MNSQSIYKTITMY